MFYLSLYLVFLQLFYGEIVRSEWLFCQFFFLLIVSKNALVMKNERCAISSQKFFHCSA